MMTTSNLDIQCYAFVSTSNLLHVFSSTPSACALFDIYQPSPHYLQALDNPSHLQPIRNRLKQVYSTYVKHIKFNFIRRHDYLQKCITNDTVDHSLSNANFWTTPTMLFANHSNPEI